MLTYTRMIHVYETDLMGIVHHSNYLRFCEETRVAWCKKFVNHDEKEIAFEHENIFDLVVVETQVKHKAPIKYRDTIKIDVQVCIRGALLVFQYRISNDSTVCAVAETTHCSVNQNLKPKRLARKYFDAIKKDTPWIETWL